MRKKLGIALILLMSFIAIVSVAEAFQYSATLPDYNNWVTWDRFSVDGYYNVQIYYNNSNSTIAAVFVDPNGTPTLYYWLDVYATYYDIYYSYNGTTWAFYGRYYY